MKLYTESGLNMTQTYTQTIHDQAEPEFWHRGNNIYIYIVAWIANFSLNQFYYPPCSHMPYIAGV